MQYVGMQKEVISILKSYNKKIELSYLKYFDANNLHGWVMSEKLAVNGFRWKKNVSKFDENLIMKIMMKIVIKDIFLK